ncbi:leucine-rich repeat-containing protein 69-like [Littorina saxatilis]|uniref:Disease resistance R13L4/SHOC-2-like LRR domain-containing protein n=1 Tax=Littorina saxatilis TaxID=31220 RepID=A0AAN9BY87_9CAEN
MADAVLIRALKGQPKTLNLCNRHLDKIPKAIGKLECVCQLNLKNNKIKKLPPELTHLFQLQVLNLGNNAFEEFPQLLQHLHNLEKLHFFCNKISEIPPTCLNGFKSLTFLNLNNNRLQTLPPEICNLLNIQFLSVDNNQLRDLPVEFCALTTLQEFHAAGNQLISLPLEFGYLTCLQRLHLQKNKIRELPEGIGKCYQLRVLDVAANELRIFPTELSGLPLKELHCEENPLLQHLPVHSLQEEEVLALKEISVRFVMRSLRDRYSYLRKAIRRYPDLRDMLAQCSKCAVCGEAFLNTWLECVHFLDAKGMNLGNAIGKIPVRALLCSYKCFNSQDHAYYGVAFP